MGKKSGVNVCVCVYQSRMWGLISADYCVDPLQVLTRINSQMVDGGCTKTALCELQTEKSSVLFLNTSDRQSRRGELRVRLGSTAFESLEAVIHKMLT